MNTETLTTAGQRGGSAPKHKWTDEEREIVRRDYRGNRQSAEAIAVHLGVSYYGVKGQVQKMGISFQDRHFWTPEQDDMLRELIPRYSVHTISKRMHRSINSIVVRSKRLRLRRRVREGWYTKVEVCEILGVDHYWLQKRIDSRALRATWHTESRPMQGGGACWHIMEEDLKHYIRAYPQELIGRNVDIIQIVEILVGLKNSA